MKPVFIVIAGPNGAGKSTAAPRLLRDLLGVVEYVNTDAIAAGLSGFHPDLASVPAARVALLHLRHLAAQRRNFAFESTLSGRGLARWIPDLKARGYIFWLIFLWLPSAEEAIKRVERRVALGGHGVAPMDIRRRYVRGLRNLSQLYLPLADFWRVYDATLEPLLVAENGAIMESERWNLINL